MTTSSSRPAAGRPATPSPSGAKAASPSAKATPSAYARFIPREELGSFAAWHPDSLHGQADAASAATPTDAEPPAPPPPDAAAVQALAAAARQGGYQDGYRDGLVALDSFKQSFAAQLSAQLGQLVSGFDAQLEALEKQMALAVAEAAVMLARRVVRSELQTRPEHVAEAAQQAVEAVLLSARHIRVIVHPDDHALVAAGAAEALAARGARLLARADVLRGGCRVESDLGQIDASIQTRWAAAAAVLGSGLPWVEGEAPAAA